MVDGRIRGIARQAFRAHVLSCSRKVPLTRGHAQVCMPMCASVVCCRRVPAVVFWSKKKETHRSRKAAPVHSYSTLRGFSSPLVHLTEDKKERNAANPCQKT